MTWEQIQYPALAQPVGDPSDFVEPVFFDGWNQPTNQPVRAVEYRYELPSVFYLGEPDDFAPAFDTFGWEQPVEQPVLVIPDTRHQHPSTFLEIAPGDFIEPFFADAWIQPISQPVLPIEFRFNLPYAFYQGEPGDFVEPGEFSTFGWEQQTNQDVIRSIPYRYWLPSVFAPDYETSISTISGVFFEAWVQPLSEPVLPVEYRYWMPDLFVQIEPGDFVVTAPPDIPFSLRDVYAQLCSKVLATGWFRACYQTQPRRIEHQDDMSAVIMLRGISIPELHGRVSLWKFDMGVRIYRRAFQDPNGKVETDISLAASTVATDLIADYTLGGTIREIDVGGVFGAPFSIAFGHEHEESSGIVYRVADISFGIIINDTVTMAS